LCKIPSQIKMKTIALLLITFLSFTLAEAQKGTPIKIEDLPDTISADIYSKHIGWKITEAFSENSNNAINFEIVIEMGKNKMHLFYDSDGNYIRGIDQKALDREAAKAAQTINTNSK
jgi:hypothetical protein